MSTSAALVFTPKPVDTSELGVPEPPVEDPRPWCDSCRTTEHIALCSQCDVVFFCDSHDEDRYEHEHLCLSAALTYSLAYTWSKQLDWVRENGFSPSYIENMRRQGVEFVRDLEHTVPREGIEQSVPLLEMIRTNSPRGSYDLQMPGMMLRNGQDQDSYDFIKYWHCSTPAPWERNGEILPDYSPEVRARFNQSDGLEDTDDLVKRIMSQRQMLAHLINLALFKVRFLLKLQSANNTKLLEGKGLPPELMYHIRLANLQPLPLTNADLARDFRNGADLTPHVQKLEQQVAKLYLEIHKANRHFWPRLRPKRKGLSVSHCPVSMYDYGNEREANALLQNCALGWQKTAGALKYIRINLEPLRKQGEQGDQGEQGEPGAQSEQRGIFIDLSGDSRQRRGRWVFNNVS